MYWLITVNPWKPFKGFEALDVLNTISNHCTIDEYVIETASREHLHIIAIFRFDEKINERISAMQTEIHKMYGKPRVNKNICCNVQYNQDDTNFRKYIRKTGAPAECL